MVVLSAVCLAQDYDEYQPAYRQPQSASRYVEEQPQPKQEPVAILKQINRHNEDGSYTYGYEGADGSFKIETKAANGEVKGKYGYVDATGNLREIVYGANKYGFQPSGEGITVSAVQISIHAYHLINWLSTRAQVPPVNYDAKEEDYEEEQQQYAARPKQVSTSMQARFIEFPNFTISKSSCRHQNQPGHKLLLDHSITPLR